MKNCPAQTDLQQFADGALSDAPSTEMLDHLETCTQCADVVETLNRSRPGSFVNMLRRGAAGVDDDVLNEPALQQVLQNLRGRAAKSITSAARNPSEQELALESGESAGQVLGPWQLQEKIGQGGMGVVYRARHERLGQQRALKVLPQSVRQSAERLARFEQEIQSLGRLDHEHIVRAYGAEEIDGQLVLIMELVEGQDLSSLVRDQGPLPVETACDYVRQAALGLQHIESAGLVHRDLKPRNLMLGQDGRARILDMGLARLLETDSSDAAVKQGSMGDETDTDAKGLTQAGQVMGTVGYLSPEQAGDSRLVDIRTDIYGLGATLYLLLCGKPPFGDRPPMSPGQFADVVRSETPTSLAMLRPELPSAVIAVVEQMMAIDPDDRFQTVRDVVRAIELLQRDERSRRSLRFRIGAGLCVAALLVGCSFVVWKTVGDVRPDDGADSLGSESPEILKSGLPAPADAPPPSFESDRAAAEFLLGLGAAIYAYDNDQPNGKPQPVASIDDWPGESGRLVDFKLPPQTTISPAELRAIIKVSPYLNTVWIGFHEELLKGHVMALKECKLLHEVILGSVAPSSVTDDDLADLLASAPQLYAVMLQGLNTDGSCLNSIVHPEKLTSLRIGSMAPIPVEGRRPRLSPDWIRSLARFPNLSTLNLPSIELTPDHVQAISTLKSVTGLYVHGATGISDCIDDIARLTQLTELGLSNDTINDSDLRHLHALTRLTKLELDRSPISPQAIHEFKQAVPACNVE